MPLAERSLQFFVHQEEVEVLGQEGLLRGELLDLGRLVALRIQVKVLMDPDEHVEIQACRLPQLD